MAETNELLQAVIASPDDDAPRLVYADELLGQNASRGELIALQIRLAREEMPRDERVRLLSATRELVREHTALFLTRFRELDGGCVFQRGFIEQLTAPVGALLRSDKFDELMRHEPIREIVLLEVSDAAIAEITSSRLMRRLTSLVCRGELSEAGARSLASSPHLRDLRVLDLAGTRIGGAGCVALAESPSLSPSVMALNTIGAGDDGAEALARGQALAGCRRLLLARNSIGERGGGALAASTVLGHLQHLGLTGNADLDRDTRDALRARWGAQVEM